MSPITIAIAISFIIGAATGYSIEHVQVVSMEKNILELKLKAKEELENLTAIANKEILDNITINKVRDIEAAKHEESISRLNDELRSSKLRKPTSWDCSARAEAKGNSTGNTKEETSSFGTIQRLHELLTTRTAIADRNSAYALECYNFVIERNCGIATGEK